jgi:hypothetical protein
MSLHVSVNSGDGYTSVRPSAKDGWATLRERNRTSANETRDETVFPLPIFGPGGLEANHSLLIAKVASTRELAASAERPLRVHGVDVDHAHHAQLGEQVDSRSSPLPCG